MPINAKKNEYVIALTYKCNWNCSYCAVNNKYDKRDGITDEDVLARISQVPNGSIVTLTGGEPGLVSCESLMLYISELVKKNCTLYLETNGLFLQRYPSLIQYFTEILYHCSIDMDNEIECLDNPIKNIRYLLIVHDQNIQNLKPFLDSYPQIKFDIIEATYPYADMIGHTLSKENKHMIMTRFASRMTKDSIQRMIHEKEFDKITWLM